MTTFYLPFVQRIGGDGSNDVHAYEHANLASTSIITTRSEEHTELEQLKLQLAAKDIEVALEKAKTAKAEEALKFATDVHRRTLSTAVKRMEENEALKKELYHTKGQLTTERAAHANTRRVAEEKAAQLETEREAHKNKRRLNKEYAGQLATEREEHSNTRTEREELAARFDMAAAAHDRSLKHQKDTLRGFSKLLDQYAEELDDSKDHTERVIRQLDARTAQVEELRWGFDMVKAALERERERADCAIKKLHRGHRNRSTCHCEGGGCICSRIGHWREFRKKLMNGYCSFWGSLTLH